MTAFAWKSIGAGIAAMGLGAASYLSRPRTDHAQVVATAVATPATSSSAPSPATSMDLLELREHLDRRFDSLNGRVSNIEGYLEAQKQQELERAIAGKR